MRHVTNDLIEQLRAPDRRARVMVEGVVQERNSDGSDAADVRQRYDQWLDSDGWPVTGLEALQSGVRLLASTGTGPESTTHPSYARTLLDPGPPAPPFIDPLSPNGLNGGVFDIFKARLGALVHWCGSESNEVALTQIQAYLNPQYDLTSAVGKRVARWRLDLFQIDGTFSTAWVLRPLASVTTDATTQAAGLVTFDLSANPPRPKRGRSLNGQFDLLIAGAIAQFAPATLALISGYDANGNPASNIAWGYDGAISSATSGAGSILYGLGVNWLFRGEVSGPIASGLSSPGAIQTYGVGPVPAIKHTLSAYSGSKTITFDSGTPLDLGGSYNAEAIRLVLQSNRPAGTGVAGQLKDDVGVWQDFVDGQFVSELLGDWSSAYQTLSIRATLSPNTALDATPVLRTLGAQALSITDLSDVADVESVQWVMDPVDHHGEIPELRLRAMHDGERDYHDAISNFLSQRTIGRLYFHLAIGHPALVLGSSHQWDGSWTFDGSVMLGPSETFSREDWIHLDDFLIDDYDLAAESATITGVSPLALVRGALPTLTDQQIGHPIADTSVGTWTEVGGATFLYPAIADINGGVGLNPWDDATAIQCPTNPSNAAATFLVEPLSPPTTPAIGQVLVQFRYKLTSGTSLTLACALMQGATQKSSVSVTVNSSSYVIGTLTPTVTELATISDWSDLRIRLTANGTGRLQVTWARIVILPFRSALRYSNAKPSTVVQDILQNQVGLDPHFQGPDFTGLAGIDTGTTLSVAKTIDTPIGGSTDLTIAKQELDALAWVSGAFFTSSNGRVVARKLYDVTINTDGTIAYQLATGATPVVFFENNDITPVSVRPGFAYRVPLYDVNWGFNDQTGQYQGIAQGISDVALANLGEARIVADQQAPESAARWVSTQDLANALSLRQVNTFGLGYMSWRFHSNYCYPELELGDVVAVQTDRFLAYDPTAERAIAGMQWVSAIVTGIFNAWGNDFQVWVPTYANIGAASAAPQAQPDPLGTRTGDLVLNGNFERQFEGWTTELAGAGVTLETGGSVYLGSYTARLDAQSLNSALISQPLFRVMGGGTIKVVGVAKILNGSGRTGAVSVQFYGTNSQSLASATAVISWSAETSFTAKSGTIAIPGNAYFARFEISSQESVSGTASLYIDEVHAYFA